ncbi:MAG: HAD-IC family P-type ATPase [Clostridiales bacterium]|nr:HAD-IC family P-type ATPase [Clostridiales bacterium]
MKSFLAKRPDDRSLLAFSLGHIIVKNLCTVFNLICLVLAVPLILVGSYKNLLYLSTVFANLAIGVFQEYRAKRAVDKLSLQIEPRVEVKREGGFTGIPAEQVECRDLCRFSAGQQVAVDCAIRNGAVEVNESLLTGESLPQLKQRGQEVLAGSIVVSGQCEAEALCTGRDSYMRKLEDVVKTYRAPRSKLMRDLKRIAATAGLSILPVGALLLVTELRRFGIEDAVVHVSAAMLSVMPMGLMLLASVSLALGVLRLGKKHALTRDLYCIEALAGVNVLCVDKTGTLTDGKLTCAETYGLTDGTLGPLPEHAHEALCNFVLAMPKDNATATALADLFSCAATEEPIEIYPFSSARKRTEMKFESGLYAVGAPDWVLPALPDWLQAEIDRFADEGLRVLLFVGDEVPLALLVLKDTIRENVPETLAFFKREQVDVCLVSGDYVNTVRAVAKKLGLEGEVADCSALETDEAFLQAVETHRLFARVTPDRKAQLVEALKKHGLVVAMVGDGVNDLPALRVADCAIAMAAGSDAPKQVAQLVLLDNDFATLPQVILEGRRVVSKIMRSAQLFMKKSIFSFSVALLMLLFALPYPYQNIQWTIMGFFAVTIPSMVLALEPNRELFYGNFIKSMLALALPAALLNLIFVLLAMFALPIFHFTDAQIHTLVIYLTAVSSLITLYHICVPMTRVRAILCVLMTLLMFAALIVLKALLDIGLPDLASVIMLAVMAAGAYPLLSLFRRWVEGLLRLPVR